MKQVFRDLDEAFTSNNECLRVFTLMFSVIVGTLVYILFYLVFGFRMETLKNHWLFFLNLSLMMLTLTYFGYRVYKRWVGPVLVRRGWNENSFLQALLLEMILLLIFVVSPLMLSAVGYNLWKLLF